MRFFTVAAALATLAAAKDILITVGDKNSLKFDPEFVTAAKDDVLVFEFRSKNHTATQSTFVEPCKIKPDGIESGFLPVEPGSATFSQWKIQVTNTSGPMWFYCRQGNHCQQGMVFAVNPTQERTFDAFKATATGAAPAPGNGSSTATSSAPASSASNAAAETFTSKALVLAAAGFVAGFVL